MRVRVRVRVGRRLEGRAGVEADEPAGAVEALGQHRVQQAQQHVGEVEDEERRGHAEGAQQHRAHARAALLLLVALDAQARRGGDEQHAPGQG